VKPDIAVIEEKIAIGDAEFKSVGQRAEKKSAPEGVDPEAACR